MGLVAALAVLAAVASNLVRPAAGSMGLGPCGWAPVATPNPPDGGAGYHPITAMAPVASDDVWFVGNTRFDASSPFRTMTGHWDGHSWDLVPSPNPGPGLNVLFGVAAAGPDDVWAVGGMQPATGGRQALILHWNGRAWSVVPAPSPGASFTQLLDVAVVARDDVWAVGSGRTGRQPMTIMLHWDGDRWTQVPSPRLNARVESVTALASDDVWAAGWVTNPDGTLNTLVLHWDGVAWQRVPSPNPYATRTRLTDISAVASDDIWAVGFGTAPGALPRSVAMHWDGARWAVVPTPAVHNGENVSAVAAVASDDVWMAGVGGGFTHSEDGERGREPMRRLLLHWDGQRWSSVPTISPGGNQTRFNDIVAVSATDLWLGGQQAAGNGLLHPDTAPWDTFTERYGCRPADPTR